MYQKHSFFIFDLDGTLAYTIEDINFSINLMLTYFNLNEVDINHTVTCIGNGAKELVKGCLPNEYQNNASFIEKAYSKYSEFYSQNYLNRTKLYPYVAEGINYLKEHGAKIAVLSNKQDALTKTICNKLFPINIFEHVLGYTGDFPHKPSPESALHLCKLLGSEPRETVIVGDSDVDMRLAKNAGLHAVGVSWGYRSSELLLKCGAEMIIHDNIDFERLI